MRPLRKTLNARMAGLCPPPAHSARAPRQERRDRESGVANVEALLIENLPHLERYALHLTRSRTEAEDLVQDCAERALLKSELFEAGSNYRAWLFTIMTNLFPNRAR